MYQLYARVTCELFRLKLGLPPRSVALSLLGRMESIVCPPASSTCASDEASDGLLDASGLSHSSLTSWSSEAMTNVDALVLPPSGCSTLVQGD